MDRVLHEYAVPLQRLFVSTLGAALTREGRERLLTAFDTVIQQPKASELGVSSRRSREGGGMWRI